MLQHKVETHHTEMILKTGRDHIQEIDHGTTEIQIQGDQILETETGTDKDPIPETETGIHRETILATEIGIDRGATLQIATRTRTEQIQNRKLL
jgi:hypothetical protein